MPSYRKRKHRSCSRNCNTWDEDDEFDIGTLIYNISDTAKFFAKAHHVAATQRQLSAQLPYGKNGNNCARRNSALKSEHHLFEKSLPEGDTAKRTLDCAISDTAKNSAENSCLKFCKEDIHDESRDLGANAVGLKEGNDLFGHGNTSLGEEPPMNFEAATNTTNICANENAQLMTTPHHKHEPKQSVTGTTLNSEEKLKQSHTERSITFSETEPQILNSMTSFESNGTDTTSASSTCWNKHFEELTTFYRANKHCNVPNPYDSNIPLGLWVERVRSKFHSDELEEEKIRKLKRLGFDFRNHSLLGKEKNSISSEFKIEGSEKETGQKNVGKKSSLKGTTHHQKMQFTSGSISFKIPELPEGVSDKVFPAPDIGDGWAIQLISRNVSKSSPSSGRVDRYFFAPDGRRFRSVVGVERFLRSSMRGRNRSLQSGTHSKRPSELWKKTLSKSAAAKPAAIPSKEFRVKINVSELEDAVRVLSAAIASNLSDRLIKRLKNQHPKFQKYYLQLLDFRFAHGHSVVPQAYRANKKLGQWVMMMRHRYALRQKGKNQPSLTDDQIQLLNDAGFVWRARGFKIQRRASVKTSVGGKQWHKALASSQITHTPNVVPRDEVGEVASKISTHSKPDVSCKQETAKPAVEFDENQICSRFDEIAPNTCVHPTYKGGDLALVATPNSEQERGARCVDGEKATILRGSLNESLSVQKLRPSTDSAQLSVHEAPGRALSVGAIISNSETSSPSISSSKMGEVALSGSKSTKIMSSKQKKLSNKEIMNENWNQIFEQFKTAYEKVGGGNLFSTKVGKKLSRWASKQRERYRERGRRLFPKDRLQKLEQLGFFRKAARKKGAILSSEVSSVFYSEPFSKTLVESSSGTVEYSSATFASTEKLISPERNPRRPDLV